jgi:hypothetical protein
MSEILPYVGVFIVGISVGAAGMWFYSMLTLVASISAMAGDDDNS